MRDRILRTMLCGLLILVASVVPARAGFYIGLQSGLSNQNASLSEIKFDKNSSFLYGAQVGLRFLSFAVEGQFYRADHNLLSDKPELALYDGRGMHYYYLGVNAKIGFPLPLIFPYLTVGYGLYSVDIKEIGSSTDKSFSLGAGAELSLGKIGLFAELKYIDFALDISSLTWDFGGLNFHCGLNYRF
jgi:opacity protein-like surface antigen